MPMMISSRSMFSQSRVVMWFGAVVMGNGAVVMRSGSVKFNAETDRERLHKFWLTDMSNSPGQNLSHLPDDTHFMPFVSRLRLFPTSSCLCFAGLRSNQLGCRHTQKEKREEKKTPVGGPGASPEQPWRPGWPLHNMYIVSRQSLYLLDPPSAHKPSSEKPGFEPPTACL